MKHSSFLPIGCTALCISLSAALLGGCAVLPAASKRDPSKSLFSRLEQKQLPYDSSSLEDGKLRLFSAGDTSTVLAGGSPLYTSQPNETLSLVADNYSDAVDYYLRTWSDATGLGGRRSALYDKSGKQVMEFDGEYSAALYGDLLVLCQEPLVDGEYQSYDGYGSCRVVDLSTGSDLTVPESAYNCIPAEGSLFFNCYARPVDLAADEYDEDSYSHMWMVEQDSYGNIRRTLPTCIASYPAYSDRSLNGWVELNTYAPGYNLSSSVLYCPATGEEFSGFVQLCGNGAASFSTESGSYRLVDLSSDARTVLGEFISSPSTYLPGIVVTWAFSNDRAPYTLYDLSTGESRPLYTTDRTSSALAVYGTDNTLKVYDIQTGEVITDVTVEPIENQKDETLICEENGYVWLSLRDNDNYDNTAIRVYGSDGLVKDLTDLTSQYDYINYLVTSPESGPLYSGSYTGPGESTLYDILDKDGNVIIKGLGYCYSYYSASVWALPEGVFEARRGFYRGWMDPSGKWIYCESVFSDLDSDDGMYFYQ